MGKPLSAAHKAAISKALKARNPGGSDKSSTDRRRERRANRTPEQLEASKARRQNRRAGKADATSTPSEVNGKDFRSMSGSDKAKAAEAMYGTGSPQHKKALGAGNEPKRKPPKSPAEIAQGRSEVEVAVKEQNLKAKTRRKSTPEARAVERDAQAQSRLGPVNTVAGDRRMAVAERTAARRRTPGKFASSSPLSEARPRLGRGASPEARAERRREIDDRRANRPRAR